MALFTQPDWKYMQLSILWKLSLWQQCKVSILYKIHIDVAELELWERRHHLQELG